MRAYPKTRPVTTGSMLSMMSSESGRARSLASITHCSLFSNCKQTAYADRSAGSEPVKATEGGGNAVFRRGSMGMMAVNKQAVRGCVALFHGIPFTDHDRALSKIIC